jgi:hypothetical protein
MVCGWGSQQFSIYLSTSGFRGTELLRMIMTYNPQETRIYMVQGWGSEKFSKYLGTPCLRGDGTTPCGMTYMSFDVPWHKNIYSLGVDDWLIDYLRFYVPLKHISLLWRRHNYWWRLQIFRPMLGAQGLWAGRYLYHATPTVTQDLGFLVSSEGPPHSVAFCDT